MKPLYVHAVGVCLPGLPDWISAGPVLAGTQAYLSAEILAPASNLLPPNERRRAPLAVRLAFRAAEDAVNGFGLKAEDWASVFATNGADTPIIHRISLALAEEARVISPTDFHNCVHNAAAGYWSIAVASRRPSTSLSAWDASFAAGLLEAAAVAHGDGEKVLLVAYDISPPAPLYATCPIAQPAGVALALSAGSAGAIARLTLSFSTAAETSCSDAALEVLRAANPATRALPLLQALAATQAAEVYLPLVSGSLGVAITPV